MLGRDRKRVAVWKWERLARVVLWRGLSLPLLDRLAVLPAVVVVEEGRLEREAILEEPLAREDEETRNPARTRDVCSGEENSMPGTAEVLFPIWLRTDRNLSVVGVSDECHSEMDAGEEATHLSAPRPRRCYPVPAFPSPPPERDSRPARPHHCHAREPPDDAHGR